MLTITTRTNNSDMFLLPGELIQFTNKNAKEIWISLNSGVYDFAENFYELANNLVPEIKVEIVRNGEIVVVTVDDFHAKFTVDDVIEGEPGLLRIRYFVERRYYEGSRDIDLEFRDRQSLIISALRTMFAMDTERESLEKKYQEERAICRSDNITRYMEKVLYPYRQYTQIDNTDEENKSIAITRLRSRLMDSFCDP